MIIVVVVVVVVVVIVAVVVVVVADQCEISGAQQEAEGLAKISIPEQLHTIQLLVLTIMGRVHSRRKQRKTHLKFRILQSLLLHILLISTVAPSKRVTTLVFVSASSPIVALIPQETIPPSVKLSEKFRESSTHTEDTLALDIQANKTTVQRNVDLQSTANIDILSTEVSPKDTTTNLNTDIPNIDALAVEVSTTVNTDIPNIDALAVDVQTTLNTDIPNIDALAVDVQVVNTTTALNSSILKTPKTNTLAAGILLHTDNTKITSFKNSTSSFFNTGALVADKQSLDRTNLNKGTPPTHITYRDSIHIQSRTSNNTSHTGSTTTPSKYTVGADLLFVDSSKNLTNGTLAKYLHYISTPRSVVTATLAGNQNVMHGEKNFAQTNLITEELISLNTTNRLVKTSSQYLSNNSNHVFAVDSLSMPKNVTQDSTVKQMKSLLGFKTLRRSNLSLQDEDSERIRARKSPMSCSQRCGEDASYPCSCNERCVVHKTCCRDLATTCPDVYSLALVKFRHLLSVAVGCDTMTSVLMVQSCPKIKGDRNPKQKTLINNKNSQNVYNGKEIMSNILSNAPVTDYESGIIYKNSSIYECNQQNKFAGISQTSAVSTKAWVIQVGIFQENRYRMNHEQQLDMSTYSYIPPASPLLTSASLCYTQETLSCISKFFAAFSVQETFCNTSVSDYYKLRKNMLSIPREYELIADHICDVCLSSYQNAPGLGDRHFLYGFRVLMSMSRIPGYAVFDVPEDLRGDGFKQPVPWWSWTCEISDRMDLESSKSCRVSQCDPRFFLTKDGLCRMGVIAEFSVQEKVLFKGKTCRIDPHAFARATECLTKIYKLVATAKPYRNFQIYNHRAGTNVTVVRAEMYFDTPTFEDQFMALIMDYNTFYAAMLVFAQNHCLFKEERARKMSTTHDSSFGPLLNRTFGTSRVTTAATGDIFSYAQYLKMTEMSKRFFLKICLQTGSINEDLDDDALSCNFDTDFFSLDDKQTMNELVSKVEDSQCVEAEAGHSKSDAVRAFLSPTVHCLSVKAVLLIVTLISFTLTLP
ncbi:hypothetical protein ElyMa_001287700 [Elysia marginata]|uniref:SMB domain-containing protein n=1 Tax=Elysia marginata TaxID=1093978 RepID=A0AAV4IE40_9GAST|nr:hypothetical protein ElyMa_001287700 [Elysia marginata]